MAEGSSQSAEVRSTKAPEVKKLKKRVGPSEVKGFYYHAAEYQREAQKKRTFAQKLLSGIAEPFTIHIRAARLAREARKNGGGDSPVLSSEFTKKALEGNLSEADIAQFKAKSQVHEVFNASNISDEQAEKATSVVTAIFSKKDQPIEPDEMKKYVEDSGLTVDEIKKLHTIAIENSNAYLTSDEMKQQFSDEAIYGSLSVDEQQLAKQLHRDAWASTVFAGARIGMIAFLASNPVGWVTAGISGAVIGGGARFANLSKEGATYDINKSKGIKTEQATGWFARAMGVDWDKDHRILQLGRAVGVGAAIGLLAKAAPHVLEAMQHGDIHSLIGDHLPTANTQSSGTLDLSKSQQYANYLRLHGTAPADTHFGTGPNASTLYSSNNTVLLSHVKVDVSNHTISATVPNKSETLTMGAEQANASAGASEHLSHFSQDARVSFLPDTTHHDWQQLHTYADQSDGHTVLRVDYQGVDDGGQTHYIDLMMGDGKHVFIQNDSILAVNGPDADKLINVYGVVNGHVQEIGQMHSINLAHELGLDQTKIDQYATLTKAADTMWQGTHNASDLQPLMFSHFGYNNGSNGDALFGVRMGGGYFDHGVFKIGASNHYYDTKLLNDQAIKTYAQSPLVGDTDTEFHSVLAPELGGVDNFEDRGLEWLRENIFKDNVVQTLDNITDFGLYNTDNLMLLGQEHAPWAIPLVLAPYVATGYVGYLYGKDRAGKKLDFPHTALNTGVTAGLLYVLPGAAATAGIGYVIGRLRGRNKGEKKGSQAAHDVSPETKPSGGASDTANPAATAIQQVTTDTTQAAIPAQSDTTSPVAPAPALPPTEPEAATEGLPATAATESEELIAPPAPTTSSALPDQAEATEIVEPEIAVRLSTGDVVREVNQSQHGDARNNVFDVLGAEEVNGTLLVDRLENLQAANQRDTFLSPNDSALLDHMLADYAQYRQGTIDPNANANLSVEQVVNIEQALRAMLPANKNQIQLIQDAQQVLEQQPTDEEKAKLYVSLASLPAGRVLELLEQEKRVDQSLNVETLLPKAIVAASVVDWNSGEGEKAKEQELEAGDFQAISQALFGDTSDEHSHQVRDAYERYVKNSSE